MNKTLLIESIQKLDKYCENENYKGYSLYNSHNSFLPFNKMGKIISFYSNQIIKRSPVNIRPFIGIKRGINPKGYGLFLHAYSFMSDLDVIEKKVTDEKAEYFFNWLVNNPSKGYSSHCWGYNYDWPHRDGGITTAYTPSVVVTGFVARAMLEYYEKLKNNKVKDILKSMALFVLNDVHLYKGDDVFCFSYTPIKKDLTINANLFAAEILSYSDYVNGESKYQKYIEKVIQFTFNNQNENGSWFYSFDYDTRKPKKQIDFHQGYVLESLLRLFKYTNFNLSVYRNKIQNGLNFYYENQFNKDGWAYWRIPKKWPVDIHNQSQGIITFSEFKDFNKNYLPFANKIADWTIENMKNHKGNFYYQKWPFITNKINYLRWNQAWMLLALCNLLFYNEH